MAEGPEKRKGDLTPREAAEDEARTRTARQAPQPDVAASPDEDAREEDGWSQPESSAQKGAERDEG